METLQNFQIEVSGLDFRPITSADMAFLLSLYGSTRVEEMKRLDWPDAAKGQFIESQFQAQHTYYQNNYRGAKFWVIRKGGQSVGRLYVHPDFQGNGLRIIDISIAPENRGEGLGTEILNQIKQIAGAMGKAVTIHVESFNPAKNLYERLGFKKISETNGVYHLMEWKHII